MRVLLLLLLTTLFLGALAIAVLLWREGARERFVEADMASAHFVYAQAFARDEATAAGGLADKLSFIARFPDFQPLAPRERASPSALLVSFTPKDDGPDPADRPMTLYARFFSEETAEGPGGLILRHFEPNSPYELEQLYLAPPDGHDFFARCPKQAGTDRADAKEMCFSVFRVGAIDVELRYAPPLLDHWDALYGGARAMLAKMTAAKGKKSAAGKAAIPPPSQNPESQPAR